MDKITLPDSLTTIHESAFMDCGYLESLTIPAGVTNIEMEGFITGCNALKEINVSEKNKTFSSIDGVLYNKDKTEIIRLPITYEGTYKIPDGVTKIGEQAFLFCHKLTAIIIPDSLTEIDDFAFDDCYKLKEITIPKGVKRIGIGAFSGCSWLTEITLPDGLKTIGSLAFSNCYSLTGMTLPDSVTEIETSDVYSEHALFTQSYSRDKSNITKLVIGNGLTDVEGILKGTNIKYLTIGNSVKKLPDMRNTPELTDIYIGDSITEIPEGAFQDKQMLSNVILGNGIQDIKKRAFMGCSNLKTIALNPQVTIIGEEAFKDCSALERISMYSNLSSIGSKAFDGCTKLDDVTFYGTEAEFKKIEMTDETRYILTYKGEYTLADRSIMIKHIHFNPLNDEITESSSEIDTSYEESSEALTESSAEGSLAEASVQTTENESEDNVGKVIAIVAIVFGILMLGTAAVVGILLFRKKASSEKNEADEPLSTEALSSEAESDPKADTKADDQSNDQNDIED